MTALISKLKIMMHTYNPYVMPLPTVNFLHFMVSEILPGQTLKVKVTTASLKVKHTMMLHTYTPSPMSLSNINFLHLTVSEI